MRQQLAGTMFAGVLALACAARIAVPASSACEQPAGMNGHYVKPSSLAPAERAYKNLYGAPIPKPIVSRHSHHKAKPQPQLRSSPLPAS